MTVLRQNFELVAGDSKDIGFHVVDSLNADVDITNYGVYWTATLSEMDSNPLIVKSVSNGIAKTDATHGIFVVSLTKIDTLALKGIYYHESKIVDTQLNEYSNTTGRMIVRNSIL
jgi:hypothetical protein